MIKTKLLILSAFMTMTACTSQAGGIANAASARFPDVTAQWQKEPVSRAVQHGYVDGYEDGTFRPDLSVTRAEFVKMIDSALKLPLAKFAAGDNWYTPYVNAAAAAGIHRWEDFTTGDWNTPISRREIARMAVRAAGVKAGDESDGGVMYAAVKAGLIQGIAPGVLAPEEKTTRAQSVTLIERILSAKAGKELPADKYALSQAEIDWRGTNLFTRFGYEPVKLPFDIPWDDSLTFTVHEFIIADMTDPDDPLAQMVRGWGIHERSHLDKVNESYVFAYKISANNRAAGRGTIHSMWGYLHQGGSYGTVFTKQDVYFDDSQIGTTTGWMCFQGNKSQIEEWLDSKEKPYFDLEKINVSGLYRMHKDPYKR